MTLELLDTGLILRFAINIVAMTVLVFGMFYMRYRDKELVTAASLFNIFAFGVLSILGAVEFSLAAGFGLFAILALFTLRSCGRSTGSRSHWTRSTLMPCPTPPKCAAHCRHGWASR